MSMPEGDPVYVRASVARRCNFNCVYCPKTEGMENRVPNYLSGATLKPKAYMRCLEHIARQGILGVSFTGGEPTLNRDLPWIVKKARQLFDRVEITTNGYRLVEILPQLAHNLDVVKVSLDTLDQERFEQLTSGGRDSFHRALTTIETAAESGIRVGINVVAMRSTIGHIPDVIDFASKLNKRLDERIVYVSVLDFYYSPSRRHFWEKNFVPMEQLVPEFRKLYGNPVIHERFGCRFCWFDGGAVDIRLKDSFAATYRAPKCTNCPHYCQEGIYGLKLSAEGWVTTCPTGDPDYGVQLFDDMTIQRADAILAPLISDIRQSDLEYGSFEKMLRLHGLHLASSKE